MTDFECELIDAALRCTSIVGNESLSETARFWWTTAAAMLAGIGSIGAAVVAIWIAGRSLREASKGERAARLRAARRVSFTATTLWFEHEGFLVNFSIHNGGSTPIHAVTGNARLGRWRSAWGPFPVVLAGSSASGYIPTEHPDVTSDPETPEPELEWWFQDDDGAWWHHGWGGAVSPAKGPGSLANSPDHWHPSPS